MKASCSTTDMNCISGLLTSITTSDSDAVLSQFFLRRILRSATEREIRNLVVLAATNQKTFDHMFKEFALCDTDVCDSAVELLVTHQLSQKTYPTIYRAVQQAEFKLFFQKSKFWQIMKMLTSKNGKLKF